MGSVVELSSPPLSELPPELVSSPLADVSVDPSELRVSADPVVPSEVSDAVVGLAVVVEPAALVPGPDVAAPDVDSLAVVDASESVSVSDAASTTPHPATARQTTRVALARDMQRPVEPKPVWIAR